MHWMGEANPTYISCHWITTCFSFLIPIFGLLFDPFKFFLVYVKSLDCAGLFARHRIIWIWNRPAVPYTGASFLSLSFWPLVHCPWWSFGQICCAAAFGTCTCPASCSWIHGENKTAEGSVLPQKSHPYICPKNSCKLSIPLRFNSPNQLLKFVKFCHK